MDATLLVLSVDKLISVVTYIITVKIKTESSFLTNCLRKKNPSRYLNLWDPNKHKKEMICFQK